MTRDLDQPLSVTWKQLDAVAEIGGVPASQLPPIRRQNVFKVDMLFEGTTPEEAVTLDPSYHRHKASTTEYRWAGCARTTTDRRPFEVDPDRVDRGLNGHRQTQDALAMWLLEHKLEPLSPTGNPDFDIAWRGGDDLFVGEVKSLLPDNESHQIRLAIGQVLEYAHRLRALPVVILERSPSDHVWHEVASAAGIRLVWPGRFDALPT